MRTEESSTTVSVSHNDNTLCYLFIIIIDVIFANVKNIHGYPHPLLWENEKNIMFSSNIHFVLLATESISSNFRSILPDFVSYMMYDM